MNYSKSLIKSTLKFSLVVLVALTSAFNSFASDSERIIQLEKDVQELKLRITNLESPQSKANINQKLNVANDGWKSLVNWRSLKKGMSYQEVRAILGEPETVRTNSVLTYWSYSNRGTVTYYEDRLDGWNEPR